MSLSFKLSFDLSDFEDDEFLQDLQHVYDHNYYKIRDKIPEDTKLKKKDIEVHNNVTKSLIVYFN